jgi:YidC/Oxa1 family membrane protein insertase
VNPLNPLYDAVGWIVKHIFDVLAPAFGATSGWTWALTIIILVVFMRLLMVPLFIKQMHTTRAMSALTPQMTALRKKYKNDKQTLNQEMMKLYQEAGVNPLMGCLPIALQLPLFFSLFSVLREIAEWKPGEPLKYEITRHMAASAQQAKILGASVADKVLFTGTTNVPLHAKLVIVLAVMVSMATTYLTIRQSMKRGMMPAATPDNPMANSQKYMAYIMPFFALTGLYWPFGLVLYWVTTNVWTLGQQWLLFKRYPWTPPAADGSVASTATVPAGTAGARALTGSQTGAKRPARTASDGKSSSQGGAKSQGTAKPQAAKSGSAAARAGSAAARNGSQNGKSGAGAATADGNGSAGSNLLRRVTNRGKEPEPEPAAPEVKIVRQQPQRQSRSKRSGKS